MMSPGFGQGKRVLDHGQHGAGKGDKSRVSDAKAYHENLSAIALMGLQPGERYTKVYGTAAIKPENTGPHIRVR